MMTWHRASMHIEEYESRRMAVADQILADPHLFDMESFGYKTSCGTVACLAGTAVLQAERQNKCDVRWSVEGLMDCVVTDGESTDIAEFARDYLGLPGKRLFYRFDLSAEDAAKALLEAPYVL